MLSSSHNIISILYFHSSSPALSFCKSCFFNTSSCSSSTTESKMSVIPRKNHFQMTTARRPSNSVHSILLPTFDDSTNEWKSLQISKGTWVLLQPRRRKSTKSNNPFRAAWKARILDFKHANGRKIINEVLVQHVFSHKDVIAHGGDVTRVKNPRCNCEY